MTDAATLSPAAPQPAHVPDSLVYDFDFFRDPALLANAHDRVLDLVANAPPIFWTPRNGGHWIFAGHAANFEASRDVETFTSEVIPQAHIKAMMSMMPPGSPHIPQPLPINIDPPDHTKYRLPLNSAFSPRVINGMQDGIRQLADSLIDGVKARGECEFMSEIAERFPVEVFLQIFGLPVERQVEYRALVKQHLTPTEDNPVAIMQKLRRIADIMHDTLVERRDNPKDDVISMLWRTRIDDKEMTLPDMENYCVVLFIAGLDTVMNGMGLGVRHLALNPDVQDKLRANPQLVGEVTEELLRRYTFTVPPRRVAKDTEFQGVTFKADDKVMLFLPGADLDPREFPDSGKFDLQRENKVHIAFGAGPHRCLGSHLARVELQILYEEMLKRLPKWRLDPAKPPRFHGGHVIGPDTLHIVWDV
jgi:cytochrome P450